MGSHGRWTAALAAAVLIAGCGGDDSGSDGDAAKEIEAVIVKAITSDDAQVKCVEVSTRNFVKTVYRTVDACKKEESKPETGNQPTGAKVANVQVDGDRATADITSVGGDADGASGEVSFAKEDGKWKVDGLSVELLRAQLTAGMRANRTGPFENAGVRACFTERIQKIGDAEFRQLAYDAIAGREPHPKFLQVVTECSTSVKEGGVSVLRASFEKAARRGLLQRNIPEAQVDCIVRRLRTLLTDQEIIEYDRNEAELGKRVAAAQAQCR